MLTGAAFDQLLGRLLGGLALIVELAADHVFALGLTLGLIHRTGDVDLDRGADLGVQANRHFVDAQALDRRVQDDLRALDLAAFSLDGFGDVAAGDLLAVPGTGAYCRSMASNYNLFTRPGVRWVREGESGWVLRPETIEDLIRLEG